VDSGHAECAWKLTKAHASRILAPVGLVPNSVQSSARRVGVAFFAALLAFALVWTGTRVEPAPSFELGSELKELKGEELLDGPDPAVAALFTDSDSAHVMLRARAIGEVVGSSTVRARRAVACIGARGPPVG
jgi:hypothetical protein